MRYICADALYEKLYPLDLVDKRLYTINAKAVADAIANAPTADVVPKSEVEELEAECERQYEQAKADILANMADGGTSCHWCIDEHKAQAKTEVAREIFEEIDVLVDDWKHSHIQSIQFIAELAELKKKYTVEQNDT